KNVNSKAIIVITNLIKMLIERGLINKDKFDILLENSIKNFNEDQPLELQMKDGNYFYVKMATNLKITSMGQHKLPGVYDFLSQYKDNFKIVVVKEVTNKIRHSIKNDNNFPNTEFFP